MMAPLYFAEFKTKDGGFLYQTWSNITDTLKEHYTSYRAAKTWDISKTFFPNKESRFYIVREPTVKTIIEIYNFFAVMDIQYDNFFSSSYIGERNPAIAAFSIEDMEHRCAKVLSRKIWHWIKERAEICHPNFKDLEGICD